MPLNAPKTVLALTVAEVIVIESVYVSSVERPSVSLSVSTLTDKDGMREEVHDAPTHFRNTCVCDLRTR